MIVGFNHNFRYQGEVYHIQTEDSGLLSPNIVTLLYQGGTILASKKTSYADITKIDNLEQVVEELMKEQHKNMLRGLKSGAFDEVIARFKAGKKVTSQGAQGTGQSTPGPSEKPLVEGPRAAQQRPVNTPLAAPQTKNGATPGKASSSLTAEKVPTPAVEVSLDEVILSYLIGEKE